MGPNKGSPKREVYNSKSLPQETRKMPKKQPNFTPKETRKRKKPKVSRRKEIIKTRAEINEIETKNKTKQNNRKDQ